MCGIIGILSNKDVSARILEGLKRLEYRGYDSAGIATVLNGVMDRRRAQGKIKNLEEQLTQKPLSGVLGIGHTRWATHGPPSEVNAHPHLTDRVALVHNGIIENYQDLKEELEGYQYRFETQTDSEVIAHLLTHYLKQGHDPVEAVDKAVARLTGAFALAMVFAGETEMMIGVRQGPPLAIGYGEFDEDNKTRDMFVASDSYALAPFAQDVSFLEDGDKVILRRDQVRIFDKEGTEVTRPVRKTAQSGLVTGKGEYRHFMLKEIFEQPGVVGDTLNSFINPATNQISIPPEVLDILSQAPRITLIACGTTYYAAMIAKYWLEQVARLPCEVDIASEFRYRQAPLPQNGVCLFISQSGETLDTLEALRYCRREGQTIISIVNTIESTIERESDYTLHTLAGPEIGVASTKAFTTQLTTLACIALAVAQSRGEIDDKTLIEYTESLRHVPKAMVEALEQDNHIRGLAREILDAKDMLYLGRGNLYPLAMEGALKLKEISYIHAEGYAAGEMKHGPIALIDEHVPVVALAPANDPLFEKSLSNIQETTARGGKILAITDREGQKSLSAHASWTIALDKVHPFVAPIVYSAPIQLLAYHIGVEKGTDVDQPRNLAKSVTVE